MHTIFFTGAGDGGEVSVGKNKKSKADPVFDVLGLCDEVNVLCGYAAKEASVDIQTYLFRIQELLFIMQADIASLIFGGSAPKIHTTHTQELEQMIAWCDKQVPPITHFIIPGGSEASLRIDFARVRVRELERVLIKIDHAYAISHEMKGFINRLSSVLFACARYENKQRGIEERAPTYQ